MRSSGDAYRVYAPGRQSHTWVFNHPDDVRRILIANHRNYAKGVASIASRSCSATAS